MFTMGKFRTLEPPVGMAAENCLLLYVDWAQRVGQPLKGCYISCLSSQMTDHEKCDAGGIDARPQNNIS